MIGLYKLACQKQLDLVRATKSFLFNQKYGRELALALDFKPAPPLDKRQAKKIVPLYMVSLNKQLLILLSESFFGKLPLGRKLS